MTSLVSVFFATAVVSLSVGATLKHHSLTVSEKGVLFKQESYIDVKNKVIYIKVPAHRDLPESRVMYEFSTGRVLRCTPSIKRCYLRNFNTKEFPNPGEEEVDIKQFEALHISPEKEEKLEKDVRQDMVVTEKIKDLSILSKRMGRAVGSYALYREEPLPKDAVILKGELDLNKAQEKQKRQFLHCPGGGAPLSRYARTTPFCNRLVLCRNPGDRSSCKLDHYHGIDFYRCLCCPNEWIPETCIGGCIILK